MSVGPSLTAWSCLLPKVTGPSVLRQDPPRSPAGPALGIFISCSSFFMFADRVGLLSLRFESAPSLSLISSYALAVPSSHIYLSFMHFPLGQLAFS